MTRRFFLHEQIFNIPSLWKFRHEWLNVPDDSTKEIICAEEQYLNFFIYLIQNLRHSAVNKEAVMSYELIDSIRAIAIKSALMIFCSIMEAVLLSHAIKRSYKLPDKERNRSFGKIIEAWENDDQGKQDLSKYLIIIKRFKSIRDSIHLPKIVNNPEFYKDLIAKEKNHLAVAHNVIIFLKNLKS